MKRANPDEVPYLVPPHGDEIRVVPASEVPLEDPLARPFPFMRSSDSMPFVFEYAQGRTGLRARLVQYVRLGRNVLRRVLDEGRPGRWGR